VNLLRRLLAAVTHSGPGYDLPPIPARGDAFDTWLKTQRDAHSDRYGVTPAWYVLDDALDRYRLHADTRTPLTEHVCEGRGDCDCAEVVS
jgi:hypothetical protein